MTFTIVFKGIHANLSYMLCFEPCPIWRKQGSDWTIVPNRHNPHYEIGSLKKLLNHEKGLIREKECIIVIQQEGHGTQDDLKNLQLDLDGEGFKYQSVSF